MRITNNDHDKRNPKYLDFQSLISKLKEMKLFRCKRLLYKVFAFNFLDAKLLKIKLQTTWLQQDFHRKACTNFVAFNF